MNTLFRTKQECCGCESCIDSCPISIISRTIDEEGFLYPYVTAPDKCLHCNKCKTVCPVKNNDRIQNYSEEPYVGYIDDEEFVKECSSGGLATAISTSFIKNGGIVYGVSYSDDYMSIEYKRASELFELKRFRTSKYAQSSKGNVYSMVHKDLSLGFKVLFIGLPCEVNAVKLLLGTDHPNLYAVSLICHGVTSPHVHKQYISNLLQAHQANHILFFSLRHKIKGWKPYYIKTIFDNDKVSLEKFENSTYGNAFIFFKRLSCNTCKIKRGYIRSDITLGDYHYGGKVRPVLSNSYGVSQIVVHTEKGNELLKEVEGLIYQKIGLNTVIRNIAYSWAIPKKWNRKEFGRAFARRGLNYAVNLPSCYIIRSEIHIKGIVMKRLSAIKQFMLRYIQKKLFNLFRLSPIK